MSRNDIFTALKSNMEKIIDGIEDQEIQEENSMVNDFGADSLEVVEVISRTQKQLKIKVPRTELSQVSDIKGLLDLFEKAAAK
ncbi:MAG: phosphopantetheine-binding protein [Cyanobacteria bacterium P01_C01_bin.118]